MSPSAALVSNKSLTISGLRHDGILGSSIASYRSTAAGCLGDRTLVIARHASQEKLVLVPHLLDGETDRAESCSCSSSVEVVDQVGYLHYKTLC